MNPRDFDYEPLESVFQALESESETLDPEMLNESLRARGLNPDETVPVLESKVKALLKKHRLSWQEAAKEKQAKLEAAAARVASWATRKKEEIEDAFARVQNGSYGPAAKMKLQVAFRKLSNVPLEDKASFLDEIETLRLLKEGDEPPEQPL